MLVHLLYFLVVFAAGFGAGRVRNKAKLAAVDAVIKSAELGVSTEVKDLAMKVRSIL